MTGHEHIHVDGHDACSLPRENEEEILFTLSPIGSPSSGASG